jgi:oxygen-independent coproporphyrinogen-3 oxidase
VGGGTPSELNPAELSWLLAALDETFSFASDAERSIECNPNSVSAPFLSFLLDSGFNRLSLGVQSFKDQHLQKLGRLHDSRGAIHSYEAARKEGFTNVSLDLIFGIPEQSPEEWQRDLETACELAPEHLSLYSLTIEAGTEFESMLEAGLLCPVSSEISLQMLELAEELTEPAGYVRYEISNYCRDGYECAHNLVYWNNEPYLGFGLSASSYMKGTRWTNTADWSEYEQSAIQSSVSRSIEERLPAGEAMGEEIMLRLRTRWGISPAALSRKYGYDFEEVFGDLLESYQREGLIQAREAGFCLTRRGIRVADEICAQFIQRSKGATDHTVPTNGTPEPQRGGAR